jgi:hypothetical protein
LWRAERHRPGVAALVVKSISVRKHRIILIALSAGMLVAAAIVGRCGYAAPEPKLGSFLGPKDVPEIGRAVRRGRWKMAKTCLERRELKIAFTVCIPDLFLGRVREISGIRTFSPTRSALAVSGGCSYHQASALSR